uniref:Uncharacterized protein n=1 Tax=Anguilla anguilla TaxID=7936 RepID=A0A0E9Y1Q7_ANGAN
MILLVSTAVPSAGRLSPQDLI